MILEKASARPYTWHSLMESANNAVIKSFPKQVPMASLRLAAGSSINITYCF
jgi:hypothetical protein